MIKIKEYGIYDLKEETRLHIKDRFKQAMISTDIYEEYTFYIFIRR